jgi:hypothetical protein
MAAAPLGLHAARVDPALMTELSAFARVGLDGVLTGRRHRARRARPTGAAVASGYAWRLADEWSGTWWPQGIAVGDYNGIPLALVSWYAQPNRRGEMGSRISVVDLRNPRRPSYAHVLLVSPRQSSAGAVLDPVLAHAGGIAWVGDRLLVAATFDGIREFRLSDLLRGTRRDASLFGYRYVLPEFAHHGAIDGSAVDRMRYSFLTVETGSGARPDAASLGLVAGEYGRDDTRRLARLSQSGDQTLVEQTFWPGIIHMQGAALNDGTWYVSSSRGGTHGGDLWTGPIDALRKHDGALPPGPEALAVWPERNQLWSVSEAVGRRWIYAMNLAHVDAL